MSAVLREWLGCCVAGPCSRRDLPIRWSRSPADARRRGISSACFFQLRSRQATLILRQPSTKSSLHAALLHPEMTLRHPAFPTKARAAEGNQRQNLSSSYRPLHDCSAPANTMPIQIFMPYLRILANPAVPTLPRTGEESRRRC